jgi:hypothetical protein
MPVGAKGLLYEFGRESICPYGNIMCHVLLALVTSSLILHTRCARLGLSCLPPREKVRRDQFRIFRLNKPLERTACTSPLTLFVDLKPYTLTPQPSILNPEPKTPKPKS